MWRCGILEYGKRGDRGDRIARIEKKGKEGKGKEKEGWEINEMR